MMAPGTPSDFIVCSRIAQPSWPSAFISDRVYDVIARNRYSWFGRTDLCRMPTEDLAARFL